MNSPITDPKRELKASLVRVATRLFAEQGYAATSIRQVAEECGCTKPAVYYYFANKEALFRGIVTAEFERMSGMIRAPSAVSSLRDRMKASLQLFVEHAQAHPDAMRLLHRIEVRPEPQMPDIDLMAARRLHLEIIAALIADGVRSGEVRADIDPADCAIALTGAINFHIVLWHAGEPWDPARLKRTVDLFFEGIGSTP